jgi:hypothetical protein
MRTTAAGAVLATVGGAGTGVAAASDRLVAELKLTAHRPNQPTGGTLHLVWPTGEDGKPKTQRVGVFRLPAGTRVNEAAIPACTATDAELRARGGAACPEGSALGPGRVTFVSGIGSPLDPVALDNDWYHAPGQIVGVFHPPGSPAPVVAVNRVDIEGSAFVARPALPPGYPPGSKTAPKQSDQEIFGLSTTRGAFLTTPPRCPRSGRWISHAKMIFEDGSVQRTTSVTRCRRR